TVSQIRAGWVISDVRIDREGCYESSRVTNHDHPTFRKYDVIHYCVPNIASRVSRTASYALTNILSPVLLAIGEAGGIKNMLWEKSGLRSGVYAYQGHLTNKYIALELALLELARAEREVARVDLVAERLADLGDPERDLLARALPHALEVEEDRLAGLGAQVGGGRRVLLGADEGLEHQVEVAGRRPVVLRRALARGTRAGV